jgi:hypothetical protein
LLILKREEMIFYKFFLVKVPIPISEMFEEQLLYIKLLRGFLFKIKFLQKRGELKCLQLLLKARADINVQVFFNRKKIKKI